MYVDDFIWLPEIIDKLIVKHHVTQDEVEEVFSIVHASVLLKKDTKNGENVYATGGQTDAGTYLIVFFIYKSNNLASILSSRDMDKKERKRYGRK